MSKFKEICFLFLSIYCISTQSDRVSLETLEVLKNIELSIDYNIDPCEDFYKYGCGNFQNVINDSVSNSIFQLMSEEYDKKISQIIEENVNSTIDLKRQSVVNKFQIFYETCKNLSQWDLLKYLEEVKPAPGVEWPLIIDINNEEKSPWPSQHLNILQLVGDLYNFGLDKIFFQHLWNLKNNTLYIVPSKSELRSTDVDAILRNFMMSNDTLNKYLQEILQVHEEWQNNIGKFSILKPFETMTFEEVKDIYPEFSKYLEIIIPQSVISNYQELKIKFLSRQFIRNLLERQWDEEEKRTFCNYLMIRFLLHIKKNHRSSCELELRHKMSLVTNFMYWENVFQKNKEKQNKFLQLIGDILKRFHIDVKENRLNFNETQMDYIQSRMANITFNIGNLPKNVTLQKVEEFYKTLLPLDDANFYKNDLLLLKQKRIESFTSDRYLEWVYSDHDDTVPFNNVYTANAILPFSTINMPAFHENLDPLFSISSYGIFLGHEFTHSIDTYSFQHFGINIIYNDPKLQKFLECLMQQHSSQFLHERLADLMGVRVAFRTYADVYNLQPEFTHIPWKKLFFLNYVQSLCTIDPNLDNNSSHDPTEVMVQQVVMNSEEFAEAFQCPQGSPMNPVKKCYVY